MPARKVDDAIAPYRSDLGRIADSVIAEKAGVSRSVVVNYRKRFGIPAYEGYKFGVQTPPPAPERRAPPPPPEAPKAFRGRKSKLDAYAHMLGKVPDGELARLAGVTPENVRTYRLRRGITGAVEVATDAPRVEPAVAAEPAQQTPNRLVFSVQVETTNGVRTYAVVGADIAEAARVAKGRASARHGNSTIMSVQYVAELL